MTKPNDRFLWAIDMLDIKPDEHILEIGCGTGTLAKLIAPKLDAGTLTAVDKSLQLIQKAEKSLEKYTSAGRVKLISQDLYDLSVNTTFDKIVAFNLNLFTKDPAGSLPKVRKMLNPHGLLYIFHQAPHEIDLSSTNPLTECLTSQSYNVSKTVLQFMNPYSSSCVIASL